MTNLVDPSKIEKIVGAKRDSRLHIGRFDTPTGEFYILHSQECVSSTQDLRLCDYSKSLDSTWIDEVDWIDAVNTPYFIQLEGGLIEKMWVGSPARHGA